VNAPRQERPKGRRAAAWDLAVTGLSVAAVFLVGKNVDAFGRAHAAFEERAWLDEVVGLALLLLLATTFLTARRAGAAARERRARDDAEERFRTIVERVPAVSYVWDGRIEPGAAPAGYISPQIETMLGYSPQDWLDHPELWGEVLHPDDLGPTLERWQAAVADGAPFVAEYRIRDATGSWRWIRDEASPLSGASTSMYQGVLVDITDRRESEERVRGMLQRLPVVAFSTDYTPETGQIHDRWIAPSIDRMLGVDAETWLSEPDPWVDRVHPEDLDRVLDAWRALARTGGLFAEEYRMLRADGTVLWIREETSAWLRDGRLRCDGVFIDISERRAAETAQRDTEERYRRLVEDLPVAVYTDAVDELSTAVYISPRYEDLTGYTPEERMSQPGLWTQILHPEDREAVLAESERTNVTGEPFDVEYRVIRKDGTVAWLHDHATLVRGPEGSDVWQGVLQDVTEQRASLDALARRDSILEAASFAAARFLEGSWTDVLDEVIGHLAEAAAAARAYVYTAAATAEDVEVTLLAGWGEDLPSAPGTRMRASGLGRWVDEFSAGRPVHGPLASFPEAERAVFEASPSEVGSILVVPVSVDGAWWGAVGLDDPDPGRSWHDGEVEAVRAAANALGAAVAREQAARRYRTLIEQIPAVTYVEDAITGEEIYVSPQITSMLGYTAEEWGAEDVWLAAVHPDDLEWVLALDAASSRSGEPFSAEYRMFTKDGELRWIREEAVPVADDRTGAISLWQGVRFDVTEQRLAEERLRAAEERYRLVVEQLPAIAYIDERRDDGPTRTWPCVYVSPQVETILGFTPEEWMNGPETWDDLIHPDDLARAARADARHYELGEPVDVELRIMGRDGEYRWIRDQAVIVRDDGGEPRWSQGIWLDVTERKLAELALEEAEQRYRAIVEHVPAAIYLDKADASMQSVYVSPQIEAITGVSPERWISEPELWLELIDPEDRPHIEATYRRAAEARAPWSAEYRMRTADGRTIWIHDETTFLLDAAGTPTYMQGVIFDITERKLAEQALRESEQREREAAERLRSLDEMKNTFLAAVSHELRSPLTSILGLSLTLERAPDLDAGDRTDLLSRLATNARKLDRLLKDLLDIDRLNRGIVEPQLRMTDVGALARRTVESLDVLGGREVQVRTDAVMIAVDPPKIERIVENLLVNAARHTGPDRRIWLEVAPANAGVLIRVADDGPGVPTEVRDEIFEPFRQGPSPSAHSPGTGVGLSLVARFAELHGGRAWVDDREGGGASFCVYIPGSVAETEPSEDPAERAS
jgi:PAS domain S-box-containing protein